MSSVGPGADLDAAGGSTRDRAEVSFELALDLQSAARARSVVAEALTRWGIQNQQVRYDVLLLTSELVSNAVRYGEAVASLELRLDGDEIEIAVEDGSSELPTLPESLVDNPYREGGRGLFIVGELAREWGVDEATSKGKRVWARISVSRSA